MQNPLSIFEWLRKKKKSDRKLFLALKTLFFILSTDIVVNILKHIPVSHHFIDKTVNGNRVYKAIYEVFREPFFVLVEHSWVEILCGIIVYYLLEDKFKDITRIPKRVDKRDHGTILANIAEYALREVRILDTSLYSFTKNYDLFENSIKEALLKKGLTIKILLLHPDTYAAEQRSKDLTIDTRTFMENMKTGLGQLHKFLLTLTDKERRRIPVKLYKTTPMMIYASWDEEARFALLHPNNLADERDNFVALEQSPLLMSFKEYFDDLWDNESYKKGKTVNLDEYLFVTVAHESTTLKGLYWGGNTESNELPRYIIDYPTQKRISELDIIAGKPVQVQHDNNIVYGQIQKIEKIYDSGKMLYAKSQIKKTYGNNIDFNLDIFEIKYANDNLVSLSNKNLVKEKLDLKGYTFVSHNQYDVMIGSKVKKIFNSLNECFEKDLEIDEYDIKAINRLKEKYPNEYHDNPRKRLMEIFDCDIVDGKITVNSCPQDNVYQGVFRVDYKDAVYECKDRVFKTVHDSLAEATEAFSKDNKDIEIKEKIKRLNILMPFFDSTVRSDITYLLGPQDFTLQNRTFKVYIHLIKSWVSNNPGYSDIAIPTSQHNELSNFDYKVVHLIKRKNVVGGVNEIIINKKKEEKLRDSLLLVNPLDALFFKKFVSIDNTKCMITNKAGAIQLDPKRKKYRDKTDDDIKVNYGFRDVLVVEFFEVNKNSSTAKTVMTKR